MTFSREDYIKLAKEQNKSEKFIKETVAYAEALQNKGIPVIFSTFHLAKILGISYDELNYIINNRSNFYKYYQIKKKRGKGKRQIIVPYNNLKSIQNFILKEILDKTTSNSNAYGFIKKKSILDNAKIHSEKQSILNLDLLKFFDSIQEKRVYGIFSSLGYAKNLSVDLSKICTVILPDDYVKNFNERELKSFRELVPIGNASLPQGAPTSPTLSNLICKNLDYRLSILAEKLNVDYSRYADDITFSGTLKNLPKIKLLRHIIRDEGFCINWNKVGVYKKGRKQIVTGLTVSNGVHVPREFKNEVKKHLYGCLNFGLENHLNFIGADDKNFYKEWLLGKIFFIKSIEPDYAKSLVDKFNLIEWNN